MVLQQSIHYPDATTQIASNRGNLQLLERGKNKWEIAKTIIRIAPNGFKYPCYLDKNGECVYYNSWIAYTSTEPDFPIIGEVEIIEEGITVYHKSWNQGENNYEENN